MKTHIYKSIVTLANCDPGVIIPNVFEVKRLCIFCQASLPITGKVHYFRLHEKDCLFVQNKRFFRGLYHKSSQNR